jgi:Glutathione S-transferase, N-terminal domain
MSTFTQQDRSTGRRQTQPGSIVPVLWQLQISDYVEKVRWALDYKRVPHIRVSLLPGLHAVKAKRLTGDTSTAPVLTIDGRSIGDSTRIITAIEERWPQPPLYPEDPAQRRRALELEEFFDEELGPHIRRPSTTNCFPARNWWCLCLPRVGRARPGPCSGRDSRCSVSRCGTDSRSAPRQPPKAAERWLSRSTGSNARSPRAVISSGSPSPSPTSPPRRCSTRWHVRRSSHIQWLRRTTCRASWREFLDSLAQRPGGHWITEIYRRHRGASSELTPAEAGTLRPEPTRN